MSTTTAATKGYQISDPPLAQKLFGNTRWAWIWVILRMYLGYTWLVSGWGKLGNPGWTQTGAILKGFWTNAVAIPTAPARPAITFDWYRAFIQSMLDAGSYTWFSKVVVAGELLIGVALVLGAFTGIAAFFGGFMNWNFMMAGSASSNPLLFTIAIFLILAWKVAGWWGLDRFLLPAFGTPWQPGRVFKKGDESSV
ncbi:DoxX [Longilinea arvoryzae]|uniref:DoxX n=1 Tax=Longilinea arvoryzae TaxID=360412 RepID=A0A0K8MYI4_9CHLR|nr:DoxX family protein [Longilinea arvoryzae]GAP16101.1 DoxX [Longilinea arvoryzae]